MTLPYDVQLTGSLVTALLWREPPTRHADQISLFDERSEQAVDGASARASTRGSLRAAIT